MTITVMMKRTLNPIEYHLHRLFHIFLTWIKIISCSTRSSSTNETSAFYKPTNERNDNPWTAVPSPVIIDALDILCSDWSIVSISGLWLVSCHHHLMVTGTDICRSHPVICTLHRFCLKWWAPSIVQPFNDPRFIDSLSNVSAPQVDERRLAWMTKHPTIYFQLIS